MATVYSPIFKKEFAVSDLSNVVNRVLCPIDQTELVVISGYAFSEYKCPACEAIYPYGMRDPSKLSEHAKKYIGDTKKKLKDKQKALDEEHSKLNKILAAAQETGLLKE